MALSTDSEPELVKNSLFNPVGSNSLRRSASSKDKGEARWKCGVKSRVSNCLHTASAISVRPCPAAQQNSPELPSSSSRPSLVQ
ncbi:hypothetical protein D3C78_1564340 [compost metagenome]